MHDITKEFFSYKWLKSMDEIKDKYCSKIIGNIHSGWDRCSKE